MGSNVVSRKTVRQALAAAMQTDLVGAGHAAQKLYRYKPAKFDNETTHIIIVTSAPVTRIRQAEPTTVHSLVDLDIWTLVLFADEAQSWTAEQSEDKRDDMEKEISDWLMDHADNSSLWEGLQLNGATETDEKVVGGKMYRTEVFPVRLELVSD